MRTPTKERFAGALAKTIHDDLASPVDQARDRAAGLFRGLRIRPTIELDPDDGDLSFSFRASRTGSDIDDTIEHLLELPGRIAAERKRRIALVFDEFQEVMALDPKLPNLMRSVFQSQPRRRARLPRQQAARDAVDLQRPQRALLAQHPADGARTTAGGRARGPSAGPVRGNRARRRRRGDPPAPRRDRWSPLRDAGARVLHLGARAPRTRGTREGRRGGPRERAQRRAQQSLRDCGTDARATSDSSCSPSARAAQSLFSEETRERKGLPAATFVQRAVKSLVRDDIVEQLPDRRYRLAEPFLAEWLDRDRSTTDGARRGATMRIWIDMTNSPHVPFFRPLIALLEERGHEVHVSARDFAQTLELLDAAGHPPRHRRTATRGCRAGGEGPRDGLAPAGAPGAGRAATALRHRPLTRLARAAARRSDRWACPSAYAYDYEFARAQHTLGSRAATRVVVPDVDPAGAARPARRHDRQGAPLPGAEGGVLPRGARTGPAVLEALGLDPSRCSPSCALLPRSRSTIVTATRSSRTSSSASATTPAFRRWSCPVRRRSATRSARRRFRRSSCRSTRSTHRA